MLVENGMVRTARPGRAPCSPSPGSCGCWRTTRARPFANAIVAHELQRELVISVPLPEDTGRPGDRRPKVHRFRSLQVEPGRRLRDFRARYGVTQTEVAQAVGAAAPSAVARWERGVAVPEARWRERLVGLLDGRHWPALRAAALAGAGLPASRDRGVRWYRRASRERPQRETVGVVVAAILDDLRTLASRASLRRSYWEHDGAWVRAVSERCGLAEELWSDLRRLEDAAYGLRWLELAMGQRLDLRHSLASQVPLSLIGEVRDGALGPEPVTDG
jgi:transcriptional regulator with XRE-family HTH domain